MTTGFLTVTELISLKMMLDKDRIDTARIKDIIESDISSPLKQRMAQGTNYYDVRHDISLKERTYYVGGQKQKDEAKSCNKLPHPFHKVLVDQKVAYVSGSPVVVGVAEPDVENPDAPTASEKKAMTDADDLESLLQEVLGERFDDAVSDWVLGASNKAIEWMHFYVDPDGELCYVITPAEQIIPIYDTQYDSRLEMVIRFYVIDVVKQDGSISKRYKVEQWTKTGVEYWAQQEDGAFTHDPDYESSNPSPHWESFSTQSPSEKTPHSWGRVPFVALKNNSKLHTDLQPIKLLVDAYDDVKSGWLDDIDDFAEMIYVLKGFQAMSSEAKAGLTEIAMFIKNLKENNAISVEADGAVSTLKSEIPVEAKEKFLQITRKEIFYFGQGVDDADETLRGAASGEALKHLYASLDLKANRLIKKLQLALKELAWFVVFYINSRDSKSYDWSQVVFTVQKAMIFNESEKIDSIKSSEGILSKKTLLENHPWVSDVDEEIKRLEQDKAAQPAQADPNAADPNAADPNAADPNAADPNAADPNAMMK